MDKKCINCNKSYKIKKKWSIARRNSSKFCSTACYRAGITDEMRSKMADNAKRNIAKETKEQRKLRMQRTVESRTMNGVWVPHNKDKVGYEVNAWKGDEAGYNAKHRWIQKHWTKTGICENCNTATKPFGNRKYGTEWANLDGNYDRDDRSTWKELCVGCHRKLDNVV